MSDLLRDLPELARPEEVAAVLRCSARSIQRACAAGDLGHTLIAGRRLISRQDVRDYMERNRCPAGTQAPASNGETIDKYTKSSGSNMADDAARRRALETAEKLKRGSGTGCTNATGKRPAPVIRLNCGSPTC